MKLKILGEIKQNDFEKTVSELWELLGKIKVSKDVNVINSEDVVTIVNAWAILDDIYTTTFDVDY